MPCPCAVLGLGARPGHWRGRRARRDAPGCSAAAAPGGLHGAGKRRGKGPAPGSCSAALQPRKVHLVGLCGAAFPPGQRTQGSGKDNPSPETGLAVLISQLNAAPLPSQIFCACFLCIPFPLL